jgi:hypothetical protein
MSRVARRPAPAAAPAAAAAPAPAPGDAAGREPAVLVDGGLGLVRARPILVGPVEATFELRPGDRALVVVGEAVARGAALAELVRDPRTEVVAGPTDPDGGQPGDAWAPPPGPRRDRPGIDRGELLFRRGARWRIGTADQRDVLEAPFPGIVSEVRPGIGIRVQSAARGIAGRDVLLGPTSGRLEVIAPRNGEVRPSDIDVGGAGAILVVGASIDAEGITRARALGVRGIVVATLGIKERREVLASESRGRAAAQGLSSFGILILDGAVRRPIASPVMALLERLAGRPVAIVGDPPCLVIEDADLALPDPEPGCVRVVGGPLLGAEGQWAGLAGPRSFPGRVVLEAGLVQFAGRPAVAIPLGDLERFS